MHGTTAAANLPMGGAPRRALFLASALLLAACVRTTTVSYLPNRERPRLSLAQGETMLARYLSIECESLLGRSVQTGEARVAVAVDSVGDVVSSELERSTGVGEV